MSGEDIDYFEKCMTVHEKRQISWMFDNDHILAVCEKIILRYIRPDTLRAEYDLLIHIIDILAPE